MDVIGRSRHMLERATRDGLPPSPPPPPPPFSSQRARRPSLPARHEARDTRHPHSAPSSPPALPGAHRKRLAALFLEYGDDKTRLVADNIIGIREVLLLCRLRLRPPTTARRGKGNEKASGLASDTAAPNAER